MIVLDASAAVLALLNDGDARRSLAQETVAIPHLADAEVAHALRAHALYRRVSADDAGAALARWARLGVRRYGAVGLLPRIWQLRDNLTAYDARVPGAQVGGELPAASALVIVALGCLLTVQAVPGLL